MAANEKQVAGSHYAAAVQHWDMVVMHKLNYFEGQITKYVMRARKKNGKQDLEKAKHFIEKYLEVYDELNELVQELPTTHVQVQYADEDFSIEGHEATGNALYKCRRCGQENWARNNYEAHLTHGGCAGKGYVAQG
jgi:hypothetical protein